MIGKRQFRTIASSSAFSGLRRTAHRSKIDLVLTAYTASSSTSADGPV